MDKQIFNINIEDEIKTSYLNYAMSVIVSRALPDVRDGLKPVHRRILFSMYEMGVKSDKPFKKCGRIVGDVLGKYHPHGDQSIYDALVRLAQEFSLRYPIIKGQGNFGSIDGDPPAAMRYTEAKMQKVAEEMLRDIEKETVSFKPNYDDSLLEPEVMPTAFPFLLVNGSSGIAVGMATNMAPHNLREVCSAIIYILESEDSSLIETEDLMKIVKGPDFPTAGELYLGKDFLRAYKTGRGSVTLRAKYHTEEKKDKVFLIIDELPFALNKSNLIIKIASLVKEERIEGISEIRDESDREGIRIVIEVKDGFEAVIIMNQLFAYTELQKNFNINNLALVDGVPKQLGIKDLLLEFIKHRKHVIRKRVEFDLKKALEKAHILEGLAIALKNIDEVIALIKASASVKDARDALVSRFLLSLLQAQAVLDMKLQKLTSLEVEKLERELKELLALIEDLKDILENPSRIVDIIKEETLNLSDKFGDERRTKIIYEEVLITSMSDLIQKEDTLVLLTKNGLIKRVSQGEYKVQSRGGKGVGSLSLEGSDSVLTTLTANTHDTLFFVTNLGKVYTLKVYEVKDTMRNTRGMALKDLFSLSSQESIVAMAKSNGFNKNQYLIFTTAMGKVAKIELEEFKNANMRGIIALKLDSKDSITSLFVSQKGDILLFASLNGNSLRFSEEQVRLTKRGTQGVTAMRLKNKDTLIKALSTKDGDYLIVASEKGYAKKLKVTDISTLKRGASGVICYKANDKTGHLKDIALIKEGDEFFLTSAHGKTLRVSASAVSTQGRLARGVQTITFSQDTLSSITRVI